MTPKKPHLKQLICDPDGSYSHTKLWANIANATATGAILNVSYNGTLSAELLGTFLVGVGAQRVASKFLDKKTQEVAQEVQENENIEDANK